MNYRTIKLPSDRDVPEFVKGEFSDFYRALFSRQVKLQGMQVVFTEYAWDMSWCDPCASEPLSNDELRSLGVFWLDDAQSGRGWPGRAQSGSTFITRLHLRYDRAHFPEDLVFQETADRGNFQGRYILRHAWTGDERCSAAATYRAELRARHEQEVERLASLTGWSIADIRKSAGIMGGPPQPEPAWWERLWRK